MPVTPRTFTHWPRKRVIFLTGCLRSALSSSFVVGVQHFFNKIIQQLEMLCTLMLRAFHFAERMGGIFTARTREMNL